MGNSNIETQTFDNVSERKIVDSKLGLNKMESEILHRLYNSIIHRSYDKTGIDLRAFNYFTRLPLVWKERLFRIFDTNHDGLLSYSQFESGITKLACIRDDAYKTLMFRFFDLNEDGKIDAQDLTTIIYNLPEELNLVIQENRIANEVPVVSEHLLESQTRTTKNIKILFAKYIQTEDMVVEIGGNYYQVVAHKIEDIVAEMIYINSKETYLSKATFSRWLFENSDLVEYINEELCPEQWLAKENYLKHSFSSGLMFQPTNHTIDEAHQFNLVISHKSKKGCCFPTQNKNKSGFKKATYMPFEIGYKKKGNLLMLQGYNTFLSVLAFVKQHTLYIFANKKAYQFIELIYLRGCYISKLRDQEQKMKFGLRIFYSDSANAQQMQLYSQSPKEMEDWIEIITESTGYDHISNYTTLNKIGEGKFSRVYKTSRRNFPDELFAMKIVNKGELNQTEKELLRYEVELSKILDHPTIPKYYDVWETKEKAYFVNDLIQNGELYYHLMKFKTLPEREVALIIYYLLDVVNYLHYKGIIHRDLKPENILIELLNNTQNILGIKLIDFGLARCCFPYSRLLDPCGTISYVAPEVLDRKPYNNQVDIYSIGVTMFFLLRGRQPFDARDKDVIIERTLRAQPYFDEAHWGIISYEAQDLVQRMLCKNPTQRINITEALWHPWLRKFIRKDKSAHDLYPNLEKISQMKHLLYKLKRQKEGIYEISSNSGDSGGSGYYHSGRRIIPPTNIIVEVQHK